MNQLDLEAMRRNVAFLKGAPTARVVIESDVGPEMVPLRGRRMGISAEHYLEIAAEVEGLCGVLTAICSTAGGIVDGYPTQRINILQRIRQLVEIARITNTCPDCGDPPTHQTPDGTFWDRRAHSWQVPAPVNAEITVNESPFLIRRKSVTYADIALLAGKPRDDLTITYWTRGNGDRNRSGTMTPGRSIDVESDMHFTAVHTGTA